MSMFPSSANPIVYAQFNLQGRWPRMLIVAGCYGLGMGAAIWLTTLGTDSNHPRNLDGWVLAITVLQMLNLLVFGSFRVESAVRGDVTSRMLESHRLMPASPLGGILGYLFGAPLQAIILAITNFALGSACCVITGLSLNHWAMLNAVLFVFAIFVYALIAQFSFLARGGFILLLILAAVAAGFSNPNTQLLPSGVALLFPIISDESVFAQMFAGTGSVSSDPSFGYLVAIAAQLVFTAIAIRVAVRRYVSPNLIGLSAPLGLMMLGTWVALSVTAFGWADTFFIHRRHLKDHSELVAEVMAAFITSALLAMFPIAGSARSARQWHRSGDPTAAKSKSHLSEWMTALLAAAIVCALMLDLPLHTESNNHAMGMTIIIILNFTIAIACLFSWGYLLRRRAWIFAVIWVVLTWVVPLIVDGVYRVMTDNTQDATMLTAISPAGALAMMWSNSSVRVFPGVAVQIALSSIPAGLLIITHARRRTVLQSRVVSARS